MFIRYLFERCSTHYLFKPKTKTAYIGLIVFINGLIIVSGFGNQKGAVGSIPKVSFVKREYRILPEDEYLKLQDDEIDIAVGSLIIAKKIYPDIDIKKYLNRIDSMATELEPKLKTCKSPDELVKTISRYLFLKQKLKYNENKYFINNVLDEKCGQCSSFSCLYLSITERLQLPFYGIAAPEHIFVRYDDGSIKINVETTTEGDIRTDEQILEYLDIFSSLKSAQDRGYLTNLTKRQILSGCLTNRGKAYKENEDWDKAIEDFKRAIDLDQKFATTYYNRGLTYKSKGDIDKAIADYTKAIDLDPKFAKAYNNRGIVLGIKGDFDRAMQDFEKAISIKPKYADAYFNRGNAYRRKGYYDSAIEDYNNAISIDPKYTDAYINRGITFGIKGDYYKSIQDFDKAISLDPKNATAYNNRGMTHQRKGDIDRAIEDYTKAVDFNPRYEEAYFNRAGAFMRKGDFEKALPDFTQVITINPKEAKYYFLRAIIYFSKGDKNNVIQDSKKAIELDPSIKNDVKEVFGQDKEYEEDEDFRKIIK